LAALDPAKDQPSVPAWRPSARRRVTVLALTLLAVGLAIAVVATGPPGPVTYGMRLPLLILSGGALVNASQWRRKVCITPDEVVLRTTIRIRRIPLPAIARVETDGARVTIRMLSGRKAVVRAVTGPSAADDLANAVATAAGPAACLAAVTPPAPVPIVTPWLIMLSAIGVALLTAEGFSAHPALATAVLGSATVVGGAALGRSWLPLRRERTSEHGSPPAADGARSVALFSLRRANSGGFGSGRHECGAVTVDA
jgi:hypothetical protein